MLTNYSRVNNVDPDSHDDVVARLSLMASEIEIKRSKYRDLVFAYKAPSLAYY